MAIRNWLLILLGFIVFVSASSGIYFLYQKRTQVEELSSPPSQKPENGFPASQESTGSGNVLGTQPLTGNGKEDSGIVVNTPQSSTTIISPVRIMGWSKIENDELVIRVKDQNGMVLGQTSTSTCPNYEVCEFESELIFASPETASGTIEIYAHSAGSKKYLSSTVVQFD